MATELMTTLITCLLVLLLMVPIIASCTTASPEPVAQAGSLQWRLNRLVR